VKSHRRKETSQFETKSTNNPGECFEVKKTIGKRLFHPISTKKRVLRLIQQFLNILEEVYSSNSIKSLPLGIYREEPSFSKCQFLIFLLNVRQTNDQFLRFGVLIAENQQKKQSGNVKQKYLGRPK
jgi:hypothetical protein